MKKTLHKIVYCIISIFLFCALLAVDFMSTANSTFFVFAEDTVIKNFDETDISNDLKDLDMEEYPKNERGTHELVLFMEYCFSWRPIIVDNDLYGLYLYVYNPTEKAVKTASINNVVNMATAYDDNGEPSAYSNVKLICLDWTENNRFYKFKVAEAFLGRAQRYASAHNGKRRYDVAGIQLAYADGTTGTFNADDEKVAKTYFYTGYAKGCLNDEDASTLKCEFDDLKTLSLDVHPTYYRPEGTNGTNNYTKDCLQSVYFSIPNEVLSDYDRLSGVSCSWVKALTNWMFLTGNKTIYNEIYKYVGKTGFGSLSSLPYGFVGRSVENIEVVGYNYPNDTKETIDPLTYCFYVEGDKNVVDTYSLESKILLAWMEDYYSDFANDEKYLIVDGKSDTRFSRHLFATYNVYTKTDVLISADETKSLLSETVSSNWWQKIWNDSTLISSNKFDGIKCIQSVSEADRKKSKANLCDSLYVDSSDYTEFISFYDSAVAKNETVFLMRFDVGTYECLEATEGTVKDSGFFVGLENTDTNAAVARQHVYLDFDIIHTEFEKNGQTIIIPVVSNPVNIVNGLEPPKYTTEDKCECIPFFKVACNYDDECECFGLGCKKWRIVAGAIAIIILFPIVYLCVQILLLPFRGANTVARLVRKRNKNKRE